MQHPNQSHESEVPVALLIFLGVGAVGLAGMLAVGVWAGLNVPRMYDSPPSAVDAARSGDPAEVREYAWSLIDSNGDAAVRTVAVDVARRAVELEPDNAESHLVLGAALQVLGRLDEAETSLTEAMRLDPDNAWVHYYLAGGFSVQYEWEESEAHARRAVELDPTIARAYGFLARALRYRFAYEEAEAVVHEGLTRDPNDAYLYGVLGEVLKNTARPDEAIEAYARAAELDPRRSQPWLEIGVLEHIRGNYDAAVEALERAQALNPDDFARRNFERGVLDASREGHPYGR